MQQKLTEIHQLELLKSGDIVYRFPLVGLPESTFNVNRDEDIKVYKVKSINKRLGTLKLIVPDENLELFTWPEDVEYLNINTSRIISEGMWWI